MDGRPDSAARRKRLRSLAIGGLLGAAGALATARRASQRPRRARQARRNRLRSLAIGGLLGAAGALATARRASQRSRRPRNAPAGLAAFEDAPCFLEIVGEEAQRYREGGAELRAGTSKPT